MRPLSPRAEALAAALRLREDDAALLAQLGGCAEPALVPRVLDHVFGDVRAVARPAAAVLQRALASASPDDLLELDPRCRTWWPDWALPKIGWRSLRPIDVSRFESLGDLEAAVLGVSSFHSDGFVREAAVTRLAALDDGRELPFLLVRLNDWVDRVAEQARAAVERRIAPAYAARFLDNLPILLRLEISRRREHRAVLDRVYALLRAPDQREVLARALTAPDRHMRRATFRLAREASHTDHVDLVRHALRDPDTLIRLEAVGDARRRLSIDELTSVLPAVVADPYPPVRREGIIAACERAAQGAEAWLVPALLDPSKSVRETARFFLRSLGRMSDFAAYYRERIRDLDSSHGLASALAGLGETGRTADAPLLLTHLVHDRPAVRAASVRALASVDLDGQLPRIVAMLRDPAPGVSHTARRVLRLHAVRAGGATLTSVFRTAPYAHSRFDALALGLALGKWDGLLMLLDAAADADERIRASAQSWLSAWVARQNRSFVQPTADQLRTIHATLEAHRFAVDPGVAAELRSVLQYWASSAARSI